MGLQVEQRTDKEAARQPTIGDHTKRPCNTDHITAGLCVENASSGVIRARRLSYKPPGFSVLCFEELRMKVNRIQVMRFKVIQKEVFCLDESYTLALS